MRYASNRGEHYSQIHDQNEELVTMADKPGKIKPKRLSKSARTHQRRLKQAARKPASAGS